MNKLSEYAKAILDLYRTIENRESKTKHTLYEKEIYEALSGTITEEDIQAAIEELHKAVMISGVETPNEPGSTEWHLTDSRGKPYVFPEKYPREWRRIRRLEVKNENVDIAYEIDDVNVAIIKLYREKNTSKLSVEDIIEGVLRSDYEGLKNTHLDKALIQCGIDDLHCHRDYKVIVITRGAVPLGQKLTRKTMECIIFEEGAKKYLEENG